MINKKNETLDNSSFSYIYEGFKVEEDGDKVDTSPFLKLSAQVSGDLDGKSLMKFESSNDGKEWHESKDIHGSSISIDEAGIVSLPVDCLYVRPFFVGSSELGVNVVIFGKGKK